MHVLTSGDEAELFLNGKSWGRRKKGPYEYRLRWNDVVDAPGELGVVAYKNGRHWAGEVLCTSGAAAAVKLSADRPVVIATGQHLVFVTAQLTDLNGLFVPTAKNNLVFFL